MPLDQEVSSLAQSILKGTESWSKTQLSAHLKARKNLLLRDPNLSEELRDHLLLAAQSAELVRLGRVFPIKGEPGYSSIATRNGLNLGGIIRGLRSAISSSSTSTSEGETPNTP